MVGCLEELLSHKRIALDTNVFIYALSNDMQFPICSELFERLSTYDGKIIASTLTLLELTVPAYSRKDIHRVAEITSLLIKKGRIQMYPVNPGIALRGAEIRASFPRLKTADAIQLATATAANATLFITADKDFLKVEYPRIEILVLSAG
jgi:predicted nucleic acid-binding protein